MIDVISVVSSIQRFIFAVVIWTHWTESLNLVTCR